MAVYRSSSKVVLNRRNICRALTALSVISCITSAQAQDAEIADIKAQLSSMRALSGPEGVDPAQQQAELEAVAKKLAEAEARLMERVSGSAATEPPKAIIDTAIENVPEVPGENIAAAEPISITTQASEVEQALDLIEQKPIIAATQPSAPEPQLIPSALNEHSIPPERAIPEIVIPKEILDERETVKAVRKSPAPQRAASTAAPTTELLNETWLNQREQAKKVSAKTVPVEKDLAPLHEIESVRIKEEITQEGARELEVQAKALVQAEKARIDSSSKLAQAESEITRLKRELQAAKNRLMIAETEVERLSTIVESRNKASIARYAPVSAAAVSKQVKNSPVNSPSAPASLRKPPAQKAAAQKNSRTVIVRAEGPKRVSEAAPEDMPIATVIAEKANLRTGPGKNNSPLITVGKGTRLAVETREGKWFRVTSPTGTRAWVSSDVVAFNVPDSSNSLSTVRVKGYDPEAADKAFDLLRSRSSK